MKESNLIDMFGLSGDPEEDARLDDLLFRLEWGSSPERPANSKETNLSSSIMAASTVQNSNSTLSALEKAERVWGVTREAHEIPKRFALYK
ncbi:hypothetical protein [Nitrosospira briensis]|uniref:hypothetical protein n=1 Tax=Nitrosospira briensis TaxID=35799 RepID=UPI0008E8A802|nr:hypothetical protein [Nitrosospira briensis]SFO38913.1 hypothetical protein SAMN05216332_11329 [Nitrosospira briensis]